MWETFEISSYEVCLNSSRADNPGMVTLHLVGGKRVFVHFYAAPRALPLPGKSDDGLRYTMFMRETSLTSCVDVLRNEKPLYFHHLPGPGPNTYLGTRQEPVGEGEA